MREITLEELLEAGCHFGHQVTRQNPKSRDFVYESRDNINIIDLAKTKEGLEDALAFIKSLAEKEGGTLVIVGTKRQAHAVIDEALERVNSQEAGSGLFFVSNRWVGGTLTNFYEVSKNFKRLQDISQLLKNEEEKAKYTKKEISLWEKERQKLEALYGGISEMKKIPDALFIIDSHLEDLAVREARKMEVCTIAIVDTNADPSLIDYPIPANDDAVGSIKLIAAYIIEAWIEGRKNLKSKVRAAGPRSAEGSGEAGKALGDARRNSELKETKDKKIEKEKKPKVKTVKKALAKTRPKITKAKKQ